MFSTKSAQALRNLFAGYHEPPILSTQQTQKLLHGLKKSFRQQLALEYGRGSEHAGEGADVATLATISEVDIHTRHSAATLHLKSILSNPLFRYDERVGPVATLGLPSEKRDPMDVFDQAVAKGMMNLKAATGCIVAKRQMMSCRDSPTGLGSSQTASRVLRWLNSTGAEADLSFLDGHAFIRALTPLLIAEGLEDCAWDWISRTVTDTNASWDNTLRIKRAAFLLAQMVRTKSQTQYGDLDAAITTILHAEQLFHSHPLLPPVLVLPWRSISWLSTVESYSHAAPSEKMFDAHIAMADLLPQTLDIETAHLHLHHPTSPDDIPAMRFFHDEDKVHNLVQSLSPDKLEQQLPGAKGMLIRPWIGFLGHDTVNHLWQTGRKPEADFVTELLRVAFAPPSRESLVPT